MIEFMIETGEGCVPGSTVSTSCGKDSESLAGDVWSWCLATLGGENLTATYERGIERDVGRQPGRSRQGK